MWYRVTSFFTHFASLCTWHGCGYKQLQSWCRNTLGSAGQCCQLSDFVALFNVFSDPSSNYFSKKQLATNLATFSGVIGDLWRLWCESVYRSCSSQRAAGAAVGPFHPKALKAGPVFMTQSLPAAVRAGGDCDSQSGRGDAVYTLSTRCLHAV